MTKGDSKRGPNYISLRSRSDTQLITWVINEKIETRKGRLNNNITLLFSVLFSSVDISQEENKHVKFNKHTSEQYTVHSPLHDSKLNSDYLSRFQPI